MHLLVNPLDFTPVGTMPNAVLSTRRHAQTWAL